MKLDIAERLQLGNFLPEKGDIFKMKFVKEIQEKASFSEAETKKYGLKVNAAGSGYTWSSTDSGVEISFTRAELDVLKEEVTAKDKAKEITAALLGLAIKIQDAKYPTAKSNK